MYNRDADEDSVTSFPETWRSVASVSACASPEIFEVRVNGTTRDSLVPTKQNHLNVEISIAKEGVDFSATESYDQYPDDPVPIVSNKALTPHNRFSSASSVVSAVSTLSAGSSSFTPKKAKIAIPTTVFTKKGTTNMITVPINVDGPIRTAQCKLLKMREATKLMKLRDNQNSLWSVFHYYARRQNSREGQLRLRRDIRRAFLLEKKYAADIGEQPVNSVDEEYKEFVEDDADEEDEKSPKTEVPELSDSETEEAVERIWSGLPSTVLPSPVYNATTSDKSTILSPIMILHLMKDFQFIEEQGSSAKLSGSRSSSRKKKKAPEPVSDILCRYASASCREEY